VLTAYDRPPRYFSDQELSYLSKLLTASSFQTVSVEGFTPKVCAKFVLKICTMDRTLQNQWNG